MFTSRLKAELDVAIRALVLVSIAAGCGGELVAQGGERQPCFPNGTCNIGLTCASGVCVDLGGGGMGGTAASGRGGAGGTMGEAGATGAAGSGGGAGTTATAGNTGAAGSGGTGGAAGTGATTGVGGIIGTAGTSGRGGASGQGGVINCGSFERPTSVLPPNILLVQDASGSMNEDSMNASCTGGCGANSKWALMTPAIIQVVSQTETTVNWGLKLFADTNNTCGVSPNTVAVGVAPQNGAVITSALAARTDANGNVTNGSRTPTRAVEDAAVTYLTGLTDGNPKFIVLATDGQPNCPASGDGATDDTPGAVTAVAAARAAGIPTFVVGISAGVGAAHSSLEMMAVAGGYPRAGTPQYYPVTSTTEFAAVLRTLVGMANACTFSLPPPPTNDGTTTRENITVRAFDGATVVNLPYDASNGWTYGDAAMTSIVLHGAVCNQVKAGTIVSLTIVYHCLIR